MKKNMILLIEFLFALLSIWVLTATHQRPESALITLRIYVLVMIGVTGTLVLMFRHYLTHHSTIDITRICETVRNLDVPAFIWTNDLNTIYTNEAMDDILGITSTEEKLGKPIGSDIREGKPTLLLLTSYENATSAEQEFLRSVVGRTKNENDVLKAKEILLARGGAEETKKTAEAYLASAQESLALLPPSPQKEILSSWCDYMVNREL